MHWSISAEGVLNITGSGKIPDYTSGANAPWYSYRSNVKSINVASGITGLGNYAFYEMNNAVSVTLADSVQTLGSNCFRYCSALRSINLPEGITEIPLYCFEGCSALEAIELPSTVRSFKDGVFCSCGSLKSIEIPEGITAVNSNYLFEYCYELKSICFRLIPGLQIDGVFQVLWFNAKNKGDEK